MEKEDWLNNLFEQERNAVNKLIEDITEFSMKDFYPKIFDNCGLYAVGSSLKGAHKDIDITLVGLEFRTLFEYDSVFLQDPETLIKEEIVVPEEHPSASKSFYEEHSLMFEGKEYRWNKDNNGCGYSSIDTYCFSHIAPSAFALELIEFLFDKRKIKFNRSHAQYEGEFNPLKPYTSSHGDFLGIRIDLKPIDFIVHAENLFVKYWKEHQVKNKLPYVVLHEWPGAESTSYWDRVTPNPKPFPDFIDYQGKKRSQMVNGARF